MGKKILVVVGSPRRKGNTECLADAFIEGAEKAGNQITKILVSELNIKGCIDCQSCIENGGTCVQDDDMRKVYPLLYNHEMIVFASPIYYYGFSSQIKALIDRFFVSETKPFSLKSCGLLVTYADTNTAVCESIKFHYKGFTEYLGLENKGIVTVEGLEAKGDITGNECLEEAKKFGESIT